MKKSKMSNKILEKRTLVEQFRTIEDQGIVSAYLTKWGTVDSYGSTFIKGSFKKTFEERKNKIRTIFNHEVLAGKLLDSGEDEVGPWVKIQLNLDTRAGFEAFAHIKAGDINCFSFGFNIIQSAMKRNVLEITEVRVIEVGPVIFEANSEATIMDIRSDNFDTTVTERELHQKRYLLVGALNETLDDIRWSNSNSEDMIGMSDTAIADFHIAYINWMTEFFNHFEKREDAILSMQTPGQRDNQIKLEMRKHDKEKLIKTTSLTEDEIKTLCVGDMLSAESRSKLVELPEPIRKAHQLRRNEVVSTLCDELRGSGFSRLEKNRFTSLLGMGEVKEEKREDYCEILDTIRGWRI